MKIICAGFPKTGTKSMARALRELGYGPVHDFEEHLEYNLDTYLDFFEGRVDGSIFKSVYKDVDAVMDQPSVDVWHILHQQFPEAKVILMVRENEEAWFKSYYGMLMYACGDKFRLPWLWMWAREYLSTTRNKLTRLHTHNLVFSTGSDNMTNMRYKLNNMLCKEEWKSQYVKHNAAVMGIVPSNNLLVFNVKEGWEPLCKFLGVPTPDSPFPYENKAGTKGNIVEKIAKFTVVKRAEAEERRNFICLLCFIALLLSLVISKQLF